MKDDAVVKLLVVVLLFIVSWHWMRGERPHCLTIRELLMLVVTVEKDQQVAYLEEVFRWFFERTRSMVIALGSGAIAAAGIAISSAVREGDSRIPPIAIGAAICLFVTAVWTNSVVSPLHREHLECRALLQDIGRFERELRAYLASKAWPQSRAMLPWPLRTGPWGSHLAAWKLRKLSKDFKAKSTTSRPEPTTSRPEPTTSRPEPTTSPPEIGRYLVVILAGVPTDLVERHAIVRRGVKECLDRASRAKASAAKGSEEWKAILEAPLKSGGRNR